MLKGAFIACDPPEHRPQRQVLADRLTAPALRSLKDQIHTWAAEHVDKCLPDTTFDAVTGLARPYPLHVTGSLLRLPRVPEGLADWASAGFQSLGPANERALGVIHLLGELEAFLSTEAGPGSLPAGSFGPDIHDAAERGAITATQAASMLREEPSRIPAAFEEALRLESPVQTLRADLDARPRSGRGVHFRR